MTVMFEIETAFVWIKFYDPSTIIQYKFTDCWESLKNNCLKKSKIKELIALRTSIKMLRWGISIKCLNLILMPAALSLRVNVRIKSSDLSHWQIINSLNFNWSVYIKQILLIYIYTNISWWSLTLGETTYVGHQVVRVLIAYF